MNNEIINGLLRIIPFLAVIVAVTIAIKRGKLTKTDLYIKSPDSNRNFILWLAVFVLFIFLTEFILYQFGILEVNKWKSSFIPLLIRIIGVVVLAPIAEELIFRGIFLHKLNQWKCNRHLAILIQAIIFVSLHSFTYQYTLTSNIGIAQSFIDALLFAYAKYYTNSLYTPIAMHSAGNLIAITEQYILI